MNVPTAVAMEIAGVDREDFNRAVHLDYYQCAPETERGTERRFDTADMIGLCAFGIFLRLEFSRRIAGGMAMEVMENVRAYGDDLEIVTFAWDMDGTRRVGPWFGEGNDKGRAVFHPAEGEFAATLPVNITKIGKHIFAGYRKIFQPGYWRNAEVSSDA